MIRKSAGLLAAALLLTGCGIPTTGVVEAGDPASGLQPTTLLYFVRDGVLFPVSRRTSGPVTTETAVAMLLKGPAAPEEVVGLFTALPPPTALPTVRVSGSDVTIDLPAGSRPLPAIAVDQLICTAATARATELPDSALPPQVTVTSPATHPTTGSPDTCPASSEATQAPLPTVSRRGEGR